MKKYLNIISTSLIIIAILIAFFVGFNMGLNYQDTDIVDVQLSDATLELFK